MSGTIFSGSSDAYDRFMGRYSRQLGPQFADFAGVAAGMRVLDVGAGTGALTDELVARLGVDAVAAAEPSLDYVAGLRQRFPGVDLREAPAEQLPWADGTFDAALGQLISVFLSDAPAAVREMSRVLRTGGTAATCMWEVEGMGMMVALNAVRKRLMPDTAPGIATDYRDEASLRTLFEGAGLHDVETTTIDVSVTYETIDELWLPAINVGGPGGPAVQRMTPEERAEGKLVFIDALGSPEGSFTLHGRAAAVRGTA
jgi:SAM-dependent methyltransferase